MTGENRRHNIAEEFQRAAQALRSVDILAAGGQTSDAVSRLYYFVLYSVRALLLSIELEPRSHAALLRLFSQHFVKPGTFDTADAHLLSRLMKYREEADYNASYQFSDQDVSRLRAEAVAFAERIQAFLRSGGWLS